MVLAKPALRQAQRSLVHLYEVGVNISDLVYLILLRLSEQRFTTHTRSGAATILQSICPLLVIAPNDVIAVVAIETHHLSGLSEGIVLSQ